MARDRWAEKSATRKGLTRNRVSKLISTAFRSNGIDPCQYFSHQFCIGAASSMAAAGIHDSLVRSLGG